MKNTLIDGTFKYMKPHIRLLNPPDFRKKNHQNTEKRTFKYTKNHSITQKPPKVIMLDFSMLKRIDDNAIREIASALQKGELDRDEIPYIMSHVVQAMAGQGGKDAAENKSGLYQIYVALSDALTSAGIGQEDDLRSTVAKISQVTDAHLQAAYRYDDLVMLAYISPGMGDTMDEMTKGKVISTGRVLAMAGEGKEPVDGRFEEVARECLMNALNNGGSWTRFHASEFLELHFGMDTEESAKKALGELLEKGSVKSVVAAEMYLRLYYGVETKGVAVERLCMLLKSGDSATMEDAAEALSRFGIDAKEMVEDLVWSGSSETRKNAIGAYLALYGDDKVARYALSIMAIEDAEISNLLGELAKEGINGIRSAASEILIMKRQGSERAGAVSDREFLLETEYPDPTSPQRLYIDCVFDAVERVLGSKASNRNELEIAVRQLAAYGTSPGQIEAIFESKSDKHNLKIILRNVENALLHAVASPDPDIRSQAACGLEKIGSDRIEQILERIVERHGEEGEVGAIADETLAKIRGDKIEILDVSFRHSPKKLPPRQPLRQRPRTLQ